MTARGAEGGEKGDPSAGVTRWEEGGVGSGAGAAGGAGGAAPTPVSARRGACAAGRWWRAARSSPSACNRRRAARRSDPAGLVDFFCVCFVLITRSRSLRIGNGLSVSCGRSSASWEEFPVRGFWLSELCGLICSEGLMLKESFNAGK